MTSVIFLSALERSAKGGFQAPILRVGHWDYPGLAGGLNVTRELLAELCENFENGVKEAPVNLYHDKDKDCGWVTKTFLSDDGQILYGVLDLTEPGPRQKVENGTLKFVSAELNLSWFDPERKETKAVFEGLALTNRPYIKKLGEIQKFVNLSEFDDDETQNDDPDEENDDTMSVTLQELADRINKLEAENNQLRQTATQPTTDPEVKARLSEMEAKQILLDEENRRLSAQLLLEKLKKRLEPLIRSKRVTPDMYKGLVSLAEGLFTEGKQTITLGTAKVQLSYDEGATATSSVDVVDAIVGMLEQVPASEVVDVTKIEEAAEGRPMGSEEAMTDEDLEAIAELSEKLQADARKDGKTLLAEDAYLQAAEQHKAGKGGKR